MSVVYTILGLTFIIFIHELGHFLVARWCGVKVYTFSIGFGPKIITFFRDRTGTEYVLSLIPLGGYVRMKGQEDMPSKQKEGENIEEDHFLAKKPWQKLLIILAGVKMNLVSAFIFIVFAFLIGIPFTSNVIGDFEIDSPLPKAGLNVGDEIVSINGNKTETMEDITTTVALNEGNDYSITAIRGEGSKQETISVVINEKDVSRVEISQGITLPHLGFIPKTDFVFMNIKPDSPLYQVGLRDNQVLEKLVPKSGSSESALGMDIKGIAAIKYVENNPGGTVDVFYREQNQIKVAEDILIDSIKQRAKGFYFTPKVQVVKGYPAAEAGLQDGDIILNIEGNDMKYWEDVYTYMSSLTSDRPLLITVLRGKEGKEVFDLTLVPKLNQVSSSYVIGVSPFIDPEYSSQEIAQVSPEMLALVPGLRAGDGLVAYNFTKELVSVKVVRDSVLIEFTYDPNQLAEEEKGHLFDYALQGKNVRYGLIQILPKSANLLADKFSDALSFFSLLIRGKLPLEAMGGPIAIFQVSHQVVNAKGWSYFLLLLAEISVSLIIINLLPIPVLDGGHACVIIYEMVRGKPVPEKTLRFMQLAGIIFLLFLIVFVNYNDINRVINN